MKTKGKFTLFTMPEFQEYTATLDTSRLRKITHIQTHHTLSPSYKHFNGTNHFEKLEGMEKFHVQERKFSEIGQHFTTFPDGTIAACRDLAKLPACIKGFNTGGICIEHLGNFDTGNDALTPEHRNTIVKMTALLCFKFRLEVNTKSVVYHHWFRLSDGFRDNGLNDPALTDHKTCPGTGFFGGNKLENAEANFIPLIAQEYTMYANQALAATVAAPRKGVVNTESLNVRSGPGLNFGKTGRLSRGTEVTILQSTGEWKKIGDNQWVFGEYLQMN